jgi:hypothetical protein
MVMEGSQNIFVKQTDMSQTDMSSKLYFTMKDLGNVEQVTSYF